MINPIVIIISVALVLSALVVSLLNRPKVPLVAASVIAVLMFFVFAAYMVDSAIVDPSSSLTGGFINFFLINSNPTVEALENLFNVLKVVDIILLAAALVTMFTETILILRKTTGQ